MDIVRAARSALAGLALATVLANAAAAQTKIAFTLDGAIDGPAAPFLLALDRGYYKAEDLNVAVDPVAPPNDPIARVASGLYEMGVADINTLIRFRDANPKQPVSAVFIVFNRPPYAVIGRKSRGTVSPKDLEGKKIGAPAADPATAAWPIFVKTSGIDASKITLENLGAAVRVPMLAAGQVDAITGLSFVAYINLEAGGVPRDDIVLMQMADYGVELYGSAVIVNPKFAAGHPEAVKGFLRAFLKGLKETVRQPTAAIETVLARSDADSRATELERLTMAIRDNIVTPEVKAGGYGGIDAARFARAIDQLALAYKFKNAKPKPEDIFDASYLPPAADRRYR
ncbi:MAG TPA: ABC transporter substrate-binding protein [Pseudolabrys sp.]|nr:ABC transporter substrate-binding protein [Pseudolabrys sp.]